MTLRLRLIGSGGLLLVVAQWLLALELGAPAPHELGWTSVSRWYEKAGPLPIAASVLRSVALVMVVWLALAVVLQLAATVPGLGRLRALADAVSPVVVRRVGGGVVSLSISAGLGSPTAPVQVATDPPAEHVAVMVLVDPSTDDLPELSAPPQPAAPARPVSIAPRPSQPDAVVETPPARAAPVAPSPSHPDEIIRAVPDKPVPSGPHSGSANAIVRAEAGDSLWTIAEAALEDATGRVATDVEVARYWERLIADNRASLVDPDNPDLIYPGQEFRLPNL